MCIYIIHTLFLWPCLQILDHLRCFRQLSSAVLPGRLRAPFAPSQAQMSILAVKQWMERKNNMKKKQKSNRNPSYSWVSTQLVKMENIMMLMTGWWFGRWLLFSILIENVILPIDFHSIIFQRGRLKPPIRLLLTIIDHHHNHWYQPL